ncbi:prevent-host-death protein [Desulfurella acetivorans A63]|nr:prevent-host-death protein [Desulfurella acetivorans A63]
MIVAANDLKKKGVKLIDELIKKNNEIIISVRGKQKYVIVDVERYEKLKNSEIELAYLETMKDFKEKRYHTDIEVHIKNIS